MKSKYRISLILLPLLSLLFLAGNLPSALATLKVLTPYRQLLKKIATPTGVRWNQWGETEKKLLDEYLYWLEGASPKKIEKKGDRLAFWINAHNTCVMKFISDRLPLEDVMSIDGFRDLLKCKIGGSERTLTEIESGIIRPEFKDPRVHFALWWGAAGSPRLLDVPYEGAKLEAQLKKQTETSLANDTFLMIKKEEAKPAPLRDKTKVPQKSKGLAVKLSPLFDWYKYDFGQKDKDVLGFITKHVSQERAKLVPKKLSEVSFMAFNWKLDQAP